MGLPEGIVRRDAGGSGFVVHMKDDGVDYFRLVKACVDAQFDQAAFMKGFPAQPEAALSRDGIDLSLKALAYTNPKRLVFRCTQGGREFILKRSFMGTLGLRRFFPRVMGLTYFTRVMRKVDAAMRAGCRSTQGYYCVAERWLSAFRQEVWVLLECVPGRDLLPDVPPSRRAALTEAVEDVLRHGLTLDDVSLGNFIDDGDAVRVIDLSCRPFRAWQAAKMRLKMRRLYGLDLPMRGIVERICGALLRVCGG